MKKSTKDLEPEAVMPEVMKEEPKQEKEPPAKPASRYFAQESRLQLAQHARVLWHLSVPAEVPYEAIHRPDFWKNVSTKFKPYDKIEVLREDGAWESDLRVIDTGPGWAKVVERMPPLVYSDTAADRALVIDGHVIKWHGNFDRYVVIRESDKMKLMAGFATRDAALTWLQGHLKAMAA